MRELYIDNVDVERKLNPRKHNKELICLIHPEQLLSPNIKLHKYPEGYIRQQFDTVTPINCNLLLTNKAHDGIWLIRDDSHNRVTIPYGIMDEDIGLLNIRTLQPISAIWETIIYSMIKYNRRLDPNIYEYEDSFPMRLHYILNTYGINSYTTKEFPIFYNFYMGEYQSELNLFLLVEADEPIDVVPPLEDYNYYNLIWYSRKDHAYNIRANRPRNHLFSSIYEDDIRCTDYGVLLLDKIFNTESIFGLLNIY